MVMTMKQARAKYRKAKAQDPENAPSLRAYARWLCVGDITPVGKLARICAGRSHDGK